MTATRDDVIFGVLIAAVCMGSVALLVWGSGLWTCR
jgi:hypothetical protein